MRLFIQFPIDFCFIILVLEFYLHKLYILEYFDFNPAYGLRPNKFSTYFSAVYLKFEK